MQEDLKPAHIQDLAQIIDSGFTHKELNYIRSRFEADHLKYDPPGGTYPSIRDRIIHWLTVENGTPLGRKLLAYLIENANNNLKNFDQIREALQGSRFVLEENDGDVELLLRISATAEKEVQSQRGFIEQHAPKTVLNRIESAEQKLANGDFEEALSEGRQSFEELTNADSFGQALQELVDKDLIGTHGQYTHDREMLYSVWGYCSTLGSHSVAGSSVSKLQAETGVILFQEAMYFLLRTLEKADKKGIRLTNWDF